VVVVVVVVTGPGWVLVSLLTSQACSQSNHLHPHLQCNHQFD
jgi:hypothetical protein